MATVDVILAHDPGVSVLRARAVAGHGEVLPPSPKAHFDWIATANWHGVLEK